MIVSEGNALFPVSPNFLVPRSVSKVYSPYLLCMGRHLTQDHWQLANPWHFTRSHWSSWQHFFLVSPPQWTSWTNPFMLQSSILSGSNNFGQFSASETSSMEKNTSANHQGLVWRAGLARRANLNVNFSPFLPGVVWFHDGCTSGFFAY